MFKVVITFGSGGTYEIDDVFETREEAEDSGMYHLGCRREGAEILSMHNPGDYPMPDEEDFAEDDFEIFEV